LWSFPNILFSLILGNTEKQILMSFGFTVNINMLVTKETHQQSPEAIWFGFISLCHIITDDVIKLFKV
jgi:hypothetical protein